MPPPPAVSWGGQQALWGTGMILSGSQSILLLKKKGGWIFDLASAQWKKCSCDSPLLQLPLVAKGRRSDSDRLEPSSPNDAGCSQVGVILWGGQGWVYEDRGSASCPFLAPASARVFLEELCLAHPPHPWGAGLCKADTILSLGIGCCTGTPASCRWHP